MSSHTQNLNTTSTPTAKSIRSSSSHPSSLNFIPSNHHFETHHPPSPTPLLSLPSLSLLCCRPCQYPTPLRTPSPLLPPPEHPEFSGWGFSSGKQLPPRFIPLPLPPPSVSLCRFAAAPSLACSATGSRPFGRSQAVGFSAVHLQLIYHRGKLPKNLHPHTPNLAQFSH